MKIARHRRLAALLALCCLLVASGCLAASIKERMLARLPQINALKAQGVVGENNQGFLEYRTTDHPQAAVVEAENADRLQVYQAIAQRQGVSVELVGRRRALQIAKSAPPGTWLQGADGTWYRK